MTPPQAPSAPPIDDDSTTLGDISKQLRTVVKLLSILIFIAGSFFGYSIWRQSQVTSCVQAARDYSGSVGVGDMVGCLTTH